MSKNNSNVLIIGAGAVALALLFSKSSSTEEKKPSAIKTGKGPTAFIINNLPYAIAANKIYPQVPIELILSFSGLESGWKIPPGFNYFGTKPGKGYTGKVQLFKTTEILPKATGYKFPKVYSITKITIGKGAGKYRWVVDDYFRKFDTPLEAYIDFAKFITSGRYKKALGVVYSVPEIVNKIQKIWQAGYATDPNYVAKHEKIVKIIKEVISKLPK